MTSNDDDLYGYPKNPKQGALCVWWVANVPGEAYRRAVANIDEAVLLINSLAEYDHFLLEMILRPDHNSMGGLEFLMMANGSSGSPRTVPIL